MAIVNWDNAFEASPAGSDSPDTIDDRIRELKENIRERIKPEHVFDGGAPADQGWHRIGSAKIYVGSSTPAQRPGNPQTTPLDSDDAGRLWFNTNNNRLYCWNGTVWVDIIAPSLFEPTIEWTSGYQVGTTATLDQDVHFSVAALNETDIALVHDTSKELRLYRFDGNSWTQVGNGFSGGFSSTSMTALNATDIALIDANNRELRTYRFDGTNWALIGFGLSISSAVTGAAIAALNGTDIAYLDFVDDDLKVYRFDGSNWAQVGSAINLPTAGDVAMTALSSSRIAYADAGSEQLRCYEFNGTNWVLVGSALSVPFIGSVTALNDTDVAICQSGTGGFRTFRFDGSTWSQVGYETPYVNSASIPGMVTLNGTDIVLCASADGTVQVYRLAWRLPTMSHHALSWV